MSANTTDQLREAQGMNVALWLALFIMGGFLASFVIAHNDDVPKADYDRLAEKCKELESQLDNSELRLAKWMLNEAIQSGEYSYQLDPKTGKIALRLTK